MNILGKCLLLGVGAFISTTRCNWCCEWLDRRESGRPTVAHESAGTIIRIICDIPAEVATPQRVYEGRIDWPFNSQDFSFPLGLEIAEVKLPRYIPNGEMVMIRFTVPEKPPFKTKFTKGDWVYRARPKAEGGEPNILHVRLSRFREWNEIWTGMRHP